MMVFASLWLISEGWRTCEITRKTNDQIKLAVTIVMSHPAF